MSPLLRRTVLKALAAGSATACARSPGESRETSDARPEAEGTGQGSALLGVEKLPSSGSWPTFDPFLFCAHHDDHYPSGDESFGPTVSLAGRRIGQDFSGLEGFSMYHGRRVPGFPAHPHRGFETVTVVRRGLLDHADSLGAAARYGEGDVQWLTAGSGIQHAEMFPLLRRVSDNPLELFQIWLNLPRERKMVAPHFKMMWSDTIPARAEQDPAGRKTLVSVRAGRYGNFAAPAPPPHSWAADPKNEVAIWTLRLEANATFTLPRASAGLNRHLYYFLGKNLRIGGETVSVRRVMALRSDAEVRLENGPEESELLLLQGKPIGESVARRGPFVMNTNAEIRQAYLDYQETRFGGWPWPSEEPVHGATPERFARRPDGTLEKPA